MITLREALTETRRAVLEHVVPIARTSFAAAYSEDPPDADERLALTIQHVARAEVAAGALEGCGLKRANQIAALRVTVSRGELVDVDWSGTVLADPADLLDDLREARAALALYEEPVTPARVDALVAALEADLGAGDWRRVAEVAAALGATAARPGRA